MHREKKFADPGKMKCSLSASNASFGGKRFRFSFVAIIGLLSALAPLESHGRSFVLIEKSNVTAAAGSAGARGGGVHFGKHYDIKGTIWLVESPSSPAAEDDGSVLRRNESIPPASGTNKGPTTTTTTTATTSSSGQHPHSTSDAAAADANDDVLLVTGIEEGLRNGRSERDSSSSSSSNAVSASGEGSVSKIGADGETGSDDDNGHRGVGANNVSASTSPDDGILARPPPSQAQHQRLVVAHPARLDEYDDGHDNKRWRNPGISKAGHKKYRLLRKTAMSEVLRELSSKEWKLARTRSNGDTVQILKDGLTGTVYLLTGVVDMDPDSLFHAITDDPYAITKWNSAIKEVEILQHVNNRTMIFHQVLNQNSGGLFKERDFVNMIFWKKFKGTYYQFYESVEYSDCPETFSFVRAENGPSGFIFSPVVDPAAAAVEADEGSGSSSGGGSSSIPPGPPAGGGGGSVKTRYQWLMDVDFKFQWMFQRLLKNVIPGVMFDYMDSVRARAGAVRKERAALEAHLGRNVTNRHGRSA